MITIILQERIMKYKKLAATIIMTSFLGMYISPAACLAKTKKKENKDNQTKSTKVLKSQVSEYRFDYINTDWWRSFDDEYLNDYIVKAIENNHDLKIATLRVEQYRQMEKMQLANELPAVGVGFSPTGMKLPGVTNTSGMWAFPITVSYEPDIFLKNRDKTRSAKKDWEKSKIEERSSYITIASAVGATYFNLIRADKLIELQKDIIQSRKEIYELMSERNKAGLTSTADLVRANKAYVSATADLSDLEKSRDTLLNNLAVLIGESPANASNLKRKPYEESYLVKIPESIPSEIIDQRPDYLAAEIMLEKAGIDTRAAKKEFLPRINLIGIMAFGSSALNTAFNWSNVFGLLAASAMFDLFAGGRKVANLKLKKNQYEQILHNYYNTNLKAIQEVNDSLSAAKTREKNYKESVKRYNLENEKFILADKKFNIGAKSKLDRMKDEERLLVAEKDEVNGKINYLISTIDVYKAVGGKDLTTVNDSL